MVDCGVAIKWMDGPKWYNNDGAVVDKEEDTFGRKTAFELIHAEKVLIIDEVGCNMSQKNDRNIGGENFSCALIAKHGSGQPLRTAISQSLGSHQQQVHQFYVQLYWPVK